LDDAIGFPVDGGDPIHVRTHRPSYRQRTCRQHQDEFFTAYTLRRSAVIVLVANTLNIAADVAAMGEVSELVTGFNRHLMTVLIVLGTLLLQVCVPYHRYVFFLKWLTLSLLSYAAVLFTVHVPWGEVALRTIWPNIKLDSATATVVTAIFGTTISPYLFFWQALKRSTTCKAGKRRGHLRKTLGLLVPNFSAFDGTPGAACSTPTLRRTSSFWRLQSHLTLRE
jgi:Mn2+/Fe2+ NRAMP family transporter